MVILKTCNYQIRTISFRTDSTYNYLHLMVKAQYRYHSTQLASFKIDKKPTTIHNFAGITI